MWEKGCGRTGIILETGQRARTLRLCVSQLPSPPPGGGSDAVRPNYSPAPSFLLHLPTWPPGFIHLLIFQMHAFFSFFSWIPRHSLPPGCSGTPASPSWAVNIKEALSWNGADSRPTSASWAWLCASEAATPRLGWTPCPLKCTWECFRGRACLPWSDYRRVTS